MKVRGKRMAGGRIHLFLDYVKHGKRTKEYTRLYLEGNKVADRETLAVAEAIAYKLKAQIEANEHGMVDRLASNQDFLDYFRGLAESNGLKSWRNTLRHLRIYVPNGIPMKHVTADWLDGFKTYLLGALAQNSAATYYSTIKAALKRAHRAQILPVNPASSTNGISSKKAQRIYLTLQELQRLQTTDCARAGVKNAFLFSCWTGLRISDVKNLTKANVMSDRISFVQKKTRQPVEVPLAKQALSYLPNLDKFDEGQPLFDLYHDDWKTNKALKLWAKRAGITKNLHFHAARHTFATLGLTYDIDIYTIKELLGHSDVRITQQYARLIDQKKIEGVNRLPVVE